MGGFQKKKQTSKRKPSSKKTDEKTPNNNGSKPSSSPKESLKIDLFLHNPIRLQIMAQLFAVQRVDMKFLRTTLNLTWGNLSFHVTKLEENDYLSVEKTHIGKKPYTLLQITSFGKSQFEQYKQNMVSFLQEKE